MRAISAEGRLSLINPSVLQSFYDRYYHSGNCSIYLAGKVSEDAIRRIETLFGSEPFGKDFRKPEKRSYVPVTSSEKRIFIERADAMQSARFLHYTPAPCFWRG